MRIFLLYALLLLLVALPVEAADQSVTLDPGDGVTVVCADQQAPTWTAPRAGCPSPAAQAGQPCPQALHDAIKTTGPDGKSYPTWHPAVDPQTGCYFGHEHGADPRTSNANATMPPFGYVGSVAGMAEPHEGFKVFVANQGDQIDAAGTMIASPADIRVVFHMGTARVGRYTNRFHSVIYDYVHQDGRALHLQGMADTGGLAAVGATCDHPRKGGRDFSTIGCNDPYEIWAFKFQVIHPDDPLTAPDQTRATAGGAVAAFDPITTRDPADNTRLVYTEQYRNGPQAANPLSPLALYRGCRREAYATPNWNNGGRPTVYWTDAYGLVNTAGEGTGLLRQEVTASAKSNGGVLKLVENLCGAGIWSPN